MIIVLDETVGLFIKEIFYIYHLFLYGNKRQVLERYTIFHILTCVSKKTELKKSEVIPGANAKY